MRCAKRPSHVQGGPQTAAKGTLMYANLLPNYVYMYGRTMDAIYLPRKVSQLHAKIVPHAGVGVGLSLDSEGRLWQNAPRLWLVV